MWIANLASLLGLTAWILWDGEFPQTAIQFRAALAAKFQHWFSFDHFVAKSGHHAANLTIILLIAVCSLFGIFLSLFIGASKHRRLRAWFAFTMLVAAWLTLLVAWPEFAWQGQRLRMRANLSEFDAIATALRDDWPTTDGERPGLGTFMAYPQGKPRMLMMLKSETSPAISAVERAEDGTLGFELRGDQSGAWLEWHPDGSTPRAFVGGIEGQYDFRRAAALGGGWYLVRYH